MAKQSVQLLRLAAGRPQSEHGHGRKVAAKHDRFQQDYPRQPDCTGVPVRCRLSASPPSLTHPTSPIHHCRLAGVVIA